MDHNTYLVLSRRGRDVDLDVEFLGESVDVLVVRAAHPGVVQSGAVNGLSGQFRLNSFVHSFNRDRQACLLLSNGPDSGSGLLDSLPRTGDVDGMRGVVSVGHVDAAVALGLQLTQQLASLACKHAHSLLISDQDECELSQTISIALKNLTEQIYPILQVLLFT